MQIIDVKALQELINQGEEVALLDVREEAEVALCKIAQAIHIPLGEVAQRVKELDPSKAWVVYCHHGMRSAKACQLLRENGLINVKNLTGGIHEWALKIDNEMTQY